jgi:hypothetical protein
MAKTPKTAKELEAMVMREARASGRCRDLDRVGVHPSGRNYPTWGCATQVNKPDNPNYPLSAACQHTLDLIIGREIAKGHGDRPLTSLEAQRRAQEVLTECGYSWPGKAPSAERFRRTTGRESSTDEATAVP